MDVFQSSLLIAAIVVMIGAARVDRAALWIFLAGADFFLSAVYEVLGFPYPPFATALFDSLLCLAIYFGGRTRWEIGLFRIFQASVLTSIVYLAGGVLNIGVSHYWYVALLEGWNWLALMVIGATAFAEWAGGRYGGRARGYLGSHLSGARTALFAKRADDPWHKKAG